MDDIKEIKIPTEKQLEILVTKEEEIRMSKEYQDECTRVKDIVNGWQDVTDQMQKKLVRDHGFDDEISCEVACNRLRRAQYLYPNNKTFKTVPVYVRENKATIGNLKVDSDVPNVNLVNMDGKETKLHDLLDNNKINVIFGSSQT